MGRIIVVATRVRFELLTVGETFQDLVFAGLPRLPRAGEELKTARFVETVGGGAAITAVAAARLGLRTGTITAAAPTAIGLLRCEGVAVTNLLRRGEPHAVTAALSTARDRTFATFTGVNARLQPRLARALGGRRAAHVHFAFAPECCHLWTRIATSLRTRGATTSWDFGWAPSLAARPGFDALVASADFVFMNELEARLYARAAARSRAAVVKLGRRGSRLMSAGSVCRVAAPRVRVVDTTGAGDAFNAGFLCAFLRGRSPRECLALGNRVGAQSTRVLGGIPGLRTRTEPTRPTRLTLLARPIRRR
jgi:hypothetical protein